MTMKPGVSWISVQTCARAPAPIDAIKLAYEAGAKRVVVADGSCNDPSRCFQRSGIWRASYALGADVVVHRNAKLRREAGGSHHAQRVIRERRFGGSWGSKHRGVEIAHPAERVHELEEALG